MRPVRGPLATAAACVAVLLVFVGVAFARSRTPSTAPLGRAGRVVVIAVPRLSLADISAGRLPAVSALARRGAGGVVAGGGALHSRATVAGFASLGAGTVVPVDIGAGAAVESGATIVVADASRIRARADDRHASSQPGALGDAIHAAGGTTAVIANDDVPASLGGPDRPRRPAAIAAMTSRGVVDEGAVDPSRLLRDDVASAFGTRSDPDAFAAALAALRPAVRLVVIDGGDTERAFDAAPDATPAAAAAMRRHALAHTDELVARVTAAAAPDDQIWVLGVSPAGHTPALTPVAGAGRGIPTGLLSSSSSHRPGVATFGDLATTFATAVGAPALPEGAVLSVDRAGRWPAAVDGLDRAENIRQAGYPIFTGVVVWGAVLTYLVGLALAAGGHLTRRVALAVTLVLAAVPLASLLARLLPASSSGVVVAVAIPLLAIGAASVAALAGRTAERAVAGVAIATTLVVAVDTLTGSHLQLSGMLGNAVIGGSRFVGVGNAMLGAAAGGLFAAYASLGSTQAPDRAARDTTGDVLRWAPVVVALWAVLALPGLGAKLGSSLVLPPAAVIALWPGRRRSWRLAVAATAAAVSCVAVASAVDLLMPAASRSHIARLETNVASGSHATLLTTIARKIATDVRVTGHSTWTWAALALGVVFATELWRTRRWRPDQRRAGLVGVAAVATLGLLANDSGILVAALALLVAGPVLALGVRREVATPGGG